MLDGLRNMLQQKNGIVCIYNEGGGMSMDELNIVLERFTNARVNAIEELNRLKERGTKIVGTYCTFSPEEVIMAAGAVPIRLCETTGEYINEGERYIPRNLCAIVKSSYGAAVSGKYPYFEAADLVVGETTCDGKKKMYEYLKNVKTTHVMQLPQRRNGEEEYSLWRNEVIRFKERLEQEFDVEISESSLKKAIEDKNKERTLINHLFKAWRAKSYTLSSQQIYDVLSNFNYRIDKNKAIEDINLLINMIDNETASINGNNNNRPKILLTGCPLGEKFKNIVDLIEKSGGNLAVVENCDWMKGSEELVNEESRPIDGIASKYLNTPCSVMTPNDNRFKIISNYIDEYKADGVIDLSRQACLTYSLESISLKKFIREKKNIPYLYIETNTTENEVGQLRTRIEAFIEML